MTPQLLEHKIGDVHLFYSSEIKRDYSLDIIGLEFHIDTILNNFLDERYRELVGLYASQQHLNGTAILSAHGEGGNQRWLYCSNGKSYSVQSWINQMDGKYAAVILHCCNPDSYKVSSRKSIVISPNSLYSETIRGIGDTQLELYLPGTGYIDRYILEWHIEQLKIKLTNLKTTH